MFLSQCIRVSKYSVKKMWWYEEEIKNLEILAASERF